MLARDDHEGGLAHAVRVQEVPPPLAVVAVSPKLARMALVAVVAACSAVTGVRWGTWALVPLYVAVVAAVVYGGFVERGLVERCGPRAGRFTVELVDPYRGERSGPLPSLWRFDSRRAACEWIASNSTGDLAEGGLRWEPVDLWAISGERATYGPLGTPE